MNNDHVIGVGTPSEAGEKPGSMPTNTPRMDNITWRTDEVTTQVLKDTPEFKEKWAALTLNKAWNMHKINLEAQKMEVDGKLKLWEMMCRLKEVCNDPCFWDDDVENREERQEKCEEEIRNLEDQIMNYKQFLTVDKVRMVYKNGGKNMIVKNFNILSELWLLSPELAYLMLNDYADLVMENLKDFGLSFNGPFVDKMIELRKYKIIIDYIQYEENSTRQSEYIAKIIEAWWSYEIWDKLWKVKNLEIGEVVDLMIDKGVNPQDIRRWMEEYFKHIS